MISDNRQIENVSNIINDAQMFFKLQIGSVYDTLSDRTAPVGRNCQWQMDHVYVLLAKKLRLILILRDRNELKDCLRYWPEGRYNRSYILSFYVTPIQFLVQSLYPMWCITRNSLGSFIFLYERHYWVTHEKLIYYADDTAILFSVNNWSDVTNDVEHEQYQKI